MTATQTITLRVPQIRALRVLSKATEPLSRCEIARRIGAKTPVVTIRAVGYSDNKKRKAFLKTKDGKVAGTPLLDLGLVEETDAGIKITKKGRKVYEQVARKRLAKLNDHHSS